MPGFSDLPEFINLKVWSDKPGRLAVEPKSDRIKKFIALTNTEGRYSLSLKGDEQIEEFLNLLSETARLRDFTRKVCTVIVNAVSYVRLVVDSDTSKFSEEYDEHLSSLDAPPLPNVFTVINGTPIYHVHKHGYGRGKEMDFWYSTAQYPEELHEECKFRVDEFDPTCRVNRIGDEPPIDAWNRFQEHCKRAIAQALREGKLKIAPAPDAAVLGGNSTMPAPAPGSVVLGNRS